MKTLNVTTTKQIVTQCLQHFRLDIFFLNSTQIALLFQCYYLFSMLFELVIISLKRSSINRNHEHSHFYVSLFLFTQTALGMFNSCNLGNAETQPLLQRHIYCYYISKINHIHKKSRLTSPLPRQKKGKFTL